MKPVLFLRIAFFLTFVHTVLHTIGAVFATAAPGAQQAAVLAMKTNQFPVMGVTRSYWDFHLGFSWFVSVMLLVEAIVFLAAWIPGKDRRLAAASHSADISGGLYVPRNGLFLLFLRAAGDRRNNDRVVSGSGRSDMQACPK